MKSFKVWRVCQGMKGLSKYDGIVKLWRVCQSMNGLSGYEGFAKMWKVCQGYLGLSKYELELKFLKSRLSSHWNFVPPKISLILNRKIAVGRSVFRSRQMFAHY